MNAINESATEICLAHAYGGDPVIVDARQLDEFQRDPDGFGAAYYGFCDAAEYREWVVTLGQPLCGGRTKAGKYCRAATGDFQLSPAEWRTRHRRTYCRLHSER